MKLCYPLFILWVFWAAPAEAQSISKKVETIPSFRLTPQIGAIVSNVLGQTMQNTDNLTGMDVGVTADFGTNQVVLETGFLFRQLGTEFVTPQGVYSRTTDYFGIPVMAKYFASPRNRNTVYLRGGVIPSFLVGKKIGLPKQRNFGEEAKLNDFEFSGAIGIGGTVEIADDASFIVNILYTRGFTSVEQSRDVFNSSIAFTTGMSVTL